MTTEINKPLLMPEENTTLRPVRPKPETPKLKPTPPAPHESPIEGLQTVDKELIIEMKSLSKEVRKLRDLEFVKILKRPWKFLWMSFLKGVMVGFGSVLGASVLVAVFVYLVAQISFVPIIGGFVEDLFSELNVTETLTEQALNNEDVISRFTDTKEQLNN